MFRSLLSVTKPAQMLGKQFVNKQLPTFSPILMNRYFSTEQESTEPKEEVKEKEAAEEVVAPVFHNQFSHKKSLLFEHTKENEPANVNDDDWFAIVQLSGTQYKLGKNDLLFTEKLDCKVGNRISLNNVLLLGSKHKTIVGHPYVENAKVVCSVEQQMKDKKVIVFKYHKRNRYSKKQGYRRQLTALRVDDILF